MDAGGLVAASDLPRGRSLRAVQRGHVLDSGVPAPQRLRQRALDLRGVATACSRRGGPKVASRDRDRRRLRRPHRVDAARGPTGGGEPPVLDTHADDHLLLRSHSRRHCRACRNHFAGAGRPTQSTGLDMGRRRRPLLNAHLLLGPSLPTLGDRAPRRHRAGTAVPRQTQLVAHGSDPRWPGLGPLHRDCPAATVCQRNRWISHQLREVQSDRCRRCPPST